MTKKKTNKKKTENYSRIRGTADIRCTRSLSSQTSGRIKQAIALQAFNWLYILQDKTHKELAQKQYLDHIFNFPKRILVCLSVCFDILEKNSHLILSVQQFTA